MAILLLNPRYFANTLVFFFFLLILHQTVPELYGVSMHGYQYIKIDIVVPHHTAKTSFPIDCMSFYHSFLSMFNNNKTSKLGILFVITSNKSSCSSTIVKLETSGGHYTLYLLILQGTTKLCPPSPPPPLDTFCSSSSVQI